MGTQMNMGDFVVSEDEAQAIDKANSMYYSAESNSTRKLTFTMEPVDDTDSPDGKCITGRLVKVMSPTWKNNVRVKNADGTDVLQEVVKRQMVIDTFDGKPCRKLWRITSKKMRDLFKVYADNNLLDKKIFILEVKGELKAGNYILTALDRPAKN